MKQKGIYYPFVFICNEYEVKTMQYFQKIVLIIFLGVAFAECSNSSSQKQKEQTEQTADILVLDELPRHIQQFENVSTFPGDLNPLNSIELIPKQTFGKTGEPYLTTIESSVVDDKNRLIILNLGTNYAQQVYVYNEDGTFHTAIGRSGRGPGEFGFAFNVKAQAGKILIRDVTNSRINIYNSTNYSIERSMLIEQLGIRDHKAVQGLEFGIVKPRNDGNYLVNFYQHASETGWRTQKYLLMDTDGNALNFEPLEFRFSFKAQGKTGESFMQMPFLGKTITALSEEDFLYTVWTHNFLIKKYDSTGKYQSAIYYPVKGSPFDLNFHTSTPFYDRGDVMKAIDMHDEELPEANPVIADMMVDDQNRIWVAVPAGVQRDSYEWWILKESGKLLAKLTLPRDQPIYDIKNGYLYSKKTNKETDSEYVVKYKIEFTER